jgi:lipopolysaccharide/colanic/teichoic acid biosynthesis glycosyltransferase
VHRPSAEQWASVRVTHVTNAGDPWWQRPRDLGLILLAAPVILPTVLILALAIRVTLGGPVLFRQPRPGRHGRPFTMMKFRTMSDARDSAGQLLPDAQRLGTVGRLLRSSSLDELPELFHVLTGEMSLVGPRPLLTEYLPLYSAEQRRRHAVRPGITGWAQVNGRNRLPWPERLAMDVWYVDHQSFWLDLRIIGLTLLRVVQRSGISAEGQATMTPFRGEQS